MCVIPYGTWHPMSWGFTYKNLFLTFKDIGLMYCNQSKMKDPVTTEEVVFGRVIGGVFVTAGKH